MASEPKPKRKLEDSSAPSHKLLAYFGEVYKVHIGFAYSFAFDKDAKACNKMLSTWTEPQIRAMIDHFFEQPDDFTHSAGFTFDVFYAQRNKLAQECRKKFDAKRRAQKGTPPNILEPSSSHPFDQLSEEVKRQFCQERAILWKKLHRAGESFSKIGDSVNKLMEEYIQKFGIPKAPKENDDGNTK